MTRTLLRLDASARSGGSVSRQLTQAIAERFPETTRVNRDLRDGLPLIDEAWVEANFTPEDQRSPEQREKLALSDALVEELASADIVVIGLPIYNFTVPTHLKAWIDLVARVGKTFRYTESGPVGLLEGKRAIVAVASGGTEFDSEIDYAGRYLRHILGFIGITEVEFIRADRLALDADATLKAAHQAVSKLAA